MADLSITAANVAVIDTASLKNLKIVQVGEAVTQGQVARYLSTDGKYYLADNDATDEYTSAGIFVGKASTDEYTQLLTEGNIDIGASLTVGMRYFLSSTPGGIMPSTDLANPDYVSYLGTATATDNLALQIHNSLAQIP